MAETKTEEKTFEIGSWLPVFPGYYDTIFESDDESTLYNINEDRTNDGLEEVTWDDCEFDYETYHQEMAEACVECIKNVLIENDLVTDVKFECIRSPRQYNWTNDNINVGYVLTEENVRNIKEKIDENLELFDKFLTTRYKSYDGFMSYYSHDAKDWLGDEFEHSVRHRHKLGSLLDFILLGVVEYRQDELYNDARDGVYLNGWVKADKEEEEK